MRKHNRIVPNLLMLNGAMPDNPVEQARKAGPLGIGDWPGYGSVYRKISDACALMGRTRGYRLSQDHVDTMADLGSGHEERMKYRLMWLRTYKWIS